MNVADLFAALGLKIDKASFNAGDRLISNIKKGIAGLVAGFTAIKSFQFLKGMINDTANLAGRLVETSQKTGIVIESLQELEHAGEQSGVNIDGLSTGLKILSRNVFDAAKGGKQAKEVFEDLGISLKTSGGVLKTSEQLLNEVADIFVRLPDGVQKSALAMKVFGKSGVELIPLLNEGSEGIIKLRKEFRSLGAGLTTRDAVALESWGDQVANIKKIITGFRNQLVVALFPTIKKITDQFLKWSITNKDLIKTKIIAFADGLVKVFEFLWDITRKIVEVGRRVIAYFRDFENRTGSLKTILVAVVTGLLAVKAAAIAASIAVFALAHPFIAIGAVLAAIGIAVAEAFGVEPLELFAKIIEKISDGIRKVTREVEKFGTFIGEKAAQAAEFFGIVETKSPAQVMEERRRALSKLDNNQLGAIARGGTFLAEPARRELESRKKNADSRPEGSLSSGARRTSTGQSPNVRIGETNVTVHATTGASAEEIAKTVTREVRKQHEAAVRNLANTYRP